MNLVNFLQSGELVGAVRGCNAPLIQQTIHSTLEMEHKVLNGEAERKVVSLAFKFSFIWLVVCQANSQSYRSWRSGVQWWRNQYVVVRQQRRVHTSSSGCRVDNKHVM